VPKLLNDELAETEVEELNPQLEEAGGSVKVR